MSMLTGRKDDYHFYVNRQLSGNNDAGKTTTMSMLTGNCYDKRCKKDDYHVYVNR
jgi:ABC-type uncharacterized transport system ATPase subunit